MADEPKQEGQGTEAAENKGRQTIPEGEPPAVAPQPDELLKKLEEAQKSAEVYKDQLLRKAAEFENYRKRTEADFLNLIKNASEELITALIPILDDIARSLRSGQDQKDHDAFYRGIELIHSKLLKILEGQGLTSFASAGKPFDVQYHDALLQIPRSDVPPHTVIEEVEPGYKLNDRVIRHAKVIVSAPEELPPAPNNEKEPTSLPRNNARNEREKQ